MTGLEYILKIKDMSNSELAEKFGIKKQNVSRWFSGDRKIPPKYIPTLSEMFQIPQGYFQKQIDEVDKLQIQKNMLNNKITKTEYPDIITDPETGKEIETVSERIDIEYMIEISKVNYKINKSNLLKNIEKSLDECLKYTDKYDDNGVAGLGLANELLRFYEDFFYLVNNPKVNRQTLREIMRAIKTTYIAGFITDTFTKEIVNAIKKRDELHKKDKKL